MIDIKPLKRNFLPEDFNVTTWAAIKPFTDDVLSRDIQSLEEFKRLIDDQNEISALLSDEGAVRYDHTSINTKDEEAEKALNYFIEEIEPELAVYNDLLNKKIVTNPFAEQYNEPGFSIWLSGMKDDVRIFREENIELGTQISLKANEVNAIHGGWKVQIDGKALTTSEANNILSGTDRTKRKQASDALMQTVAQDKDALDGLFDGMLSLRKDMAKNAGFDNFVDYAFTSLSRHDYSVQDCRDFHTSIVENVLPLVKKSQIMRKQQMGLETLYPYDLAVDPLGRTALVVCKDEADFINKTQNMFDAVDPFFGDSFRLLNDNNRLDVMARANKKQGGYMMPMYGTNVPFILMNATNNLDDLVTMVHEGGHAIHEISMTDKKLAAYRNYPSEVAELGSMTMELLTMDHWDKFFNNKEDLARAKREHLEEIITMLPWISIVDEFQQDLYITKDQSIEGRHKLWQEKCDKYSTGEVDVLPGMYGHANRNSWHKQNHIFERPFYYIDYGIAQLGALQIWRNYKENPEQAVQQYKDAMALGYTKSMAEIYETAGAKFDFSSKMVKELMTFVGDEITKLHEIEMAEHKKNNPLLPL